MVFIRLKHNYFKNVKKLIKVLISHDDNEGKSITAQAYSFFITSKLSENL